MQKTEARSFAHLVGSVYLVYFVVAILGMLLVHWKTIPGIAPVWASNALYVATTLFLYRLFRPVNGLLALVAAAISLLGCATDLVNHLHRGPALVSPLIFFGPFCILLGILILRSRFLPHWLGWPLIAAGIGWLAYLIPTVSLHAKIAIFSVGFLAEFELMLWLLIKGVDETRWAPAKAR